MQKPSFKFDSVTVSRYQEHLKKDPQSLVFAALAEAYLERGLIPEAESLVEKGVQKHPNYVGGFLVWARILQTKKQLADAEKVIRKGVELAPENLLARQTLADILTEKQDAKEALQAHKMVLFLNPQSEKSRKYVEKLETLTADEYPEDVFVIKRQENPLPTDSQDIKASDKSDSVDLLRELSVLDALLVRGDLMGAEIMLSDLEKFFPQHPELKKRADLLGKPMEAPQTLHPIVNRERLALEKKIQRLKTILHNLERRPILPG